MPFKKLFGRSQPPESSPTLSPSPTEQVISPWEAQNEGTIARLARFIDFAEGFTLGFVEISFPEDIDGLLKVLRKRPECHLVEFYVFDLPDPDLTYLQDELSERINQIAKPMSTLADSKRVILVKGLENSIGLFGDYPPVLQDLNFVRDALADSVPYPVLFFLPSYAINRVIKFAPDFWSWKSGVFKIKSVQNSQDNASIRGLHATKLLGSLSQLERQERVQLLERLAQEFSPLEGHRSKDDLRMCVKTLIALASLQVNIGEFPKGKEVLDQTAKILDSPNWQPETSQDIVLRLEYLRWRGFLNLRLGKIVDAEAKFKASLVLNNGIDEFEKGHILELLGRVEAKKGNLEEAATLYEKSLIIIERRRNPGLKATILSNMADLKIKQGQVEDAIALLHQSLKIKEHIGDAQGVAVNQRELAGIKASQGELEEAQRLYEESLSALTRLEEVSYKARALWKYGQFLADHKADFVTATTYLQESLAILQRIGGADTANVQNSLEQVKNRANTHS